MIEMRALLAGAASMCLLVLVPVAVNAQTEPGVVRTAPSNAPHVIVIVPAPRAAVVERALLLIRGELAGVGLGAEVRDQAPAAAAAASDGVYGVLSLEALGSTTVIRAYAPGGAKPIVASVDADEAGVDAEVIAVRAVETLRAAVLQFAQAHQQGLPDAVRGFAHLPKPPPSPSAPPPQPRPRARPPSPQLTAPLQVFLGPELVWHPRLVPSVGAQGGLIIGPSWGFVALSAESTLYRSQLSARAGHADVSRRVLGLQLGARLRWARNWELSARVGSGYADYAVRGRPESGYLGLAPSHRSFTGSVGAGGAYYFGRVLGLFLNIAGDVALDAPIVRIAGSPVGTLDRPAFTVSSGALVGSF